MRRPFLLLIGLALAGCALASWAWPRLDIVPAPPTMSEATREHLADFEEHFGADDILLVALEDQGESPLLDAEALARQRALVARLEAEADVVQVVALANLEDFSVRSLFGNWIPTPPRPLLPEDGGVPPGAREALREDPFLRTGMLDAEGRTTALWVLLDPALREAPDRLERVRALADRIPREFPGSDRFTVRVAGLPLLDVRLRELQRVHALRVGPLALGIVLLLGLLLGVGGRRLCAWALAWPLVVGLGLTALALTGRGLHLFSADIVPLLAMTGGSVLLHGAFGRERPRRGWLSRSELISGLAAGTTALGFLTLVTSPYAPLAAFGLEAAVGTLLAFLLPAAAMTLAGGPRRRRRLGLPGRRLGRGAGRGIALLAACAALPFFAFLSGAPEGGDLLDVLPAEDPVVRETREALASMEALFGVEIVARLDEEAVERLREPEFLRDLAAFERRLEERVGAEWPRVFGPADLLDHVADKIRGVDEEIGLVEARSQAAELAGRFLLGPWLGLSELGERRDLGELVAVLRRRLGQIIAPDGTRIRWHARLASPAPEALLRRAEELRPFLAAEARRLGVREFVLTGSTLAYAETTRAVREAQVQGLSLLALLLALLLACLLRGARLAFLVILVSAGTVAVVLNAARLLEMPFDLYTSVLAATLVGSLVDDSLHVAMAFRRSRGGRAHRVRVALARSGPGVWATTLALSGGFLAFLASPLPHYRPFALLGLVALGAACVFDLVVLPRLLLLSRGGGRRRAR